MNMRLWLRYSQFDLVGYVGPVIEGLGEELHPGLVDGARLRQREPAPAPVRPHGSPQRPAAPLLDVRQNRQQLPTLAAAQRVRARPEELGRRHVTVAPARHGDGQELGGAALPGHRPAVGRPEVQRAEASVGGRRRGAAPGQREQPVAPRRRRPGQREHVHVARQPVPQAALPPVAAHEARLIRLGEAAQLAGRQQRAGGWQQRAGGRRGGGGGRLGGRGGCWF